MLLKKYFLLAFCLLLVLKLSAQDESNPTVLRAKGEPVILNNDTLFYIYTNQGSFTPFDRAEAIVERLTRLAEDNTLESDSIKTNISEIATEVIYKDIILFTITDIEASYSNADRNELAAEYISTIKVSINKLKDELNIQTIFINISILILIISLLWGLIYGVNKLFKLLRRKLITLKETKLKGINIRDYELVSPQKQVSALFYLLKILRILLIVLLIYISLPFLFSVFPASKPIAETLFKYVFDPFKAILLAIINFIPNLLTILVIYFVTTYIVKFFKFLAIEVENGSLKITNFYADWAMPTFNIVRALLYIFMFVVIWPYLPGSGSPVFQGVSVLLGILISFGSSSAISNMVAGLVITYMRPFKIGDRVKVGDVIGDVVEKNLLVTRVMNAKNEEITIPNSSILSGYTTNYSIAAREREGLIIYTTVTIGYDIPWKKVHELLINAANKSKFILNKPTPFILQTSLDDFYVSYQLNAYTKNINQMANIYSDLHQHIQDAFNEAGVEIMSPHYRAQREGNQTTIPENYL